MGLGTEDCSTALGGKYYHDLHFTYEETEAENMEEAVPDHTAIK